MESLGFLVLFFTGTGHSQEIRREVKDTYYLGKYPGILDCIPVPPTSLSHQSP